MIHFRLSIASMILAGQRTKNKTFPHNIETFALLTMFLIDNKKHLSTFHKNDDGSSSELGK